MAEQVFSCFEGKSCYQKWDNRCTKFDEEPVLAANATEVHFPPM